MNHDTQTKGFSLLEMVISLGLISGVALVASESFTLDKKGLNLLNDRYHVENVRNKVIDMMKYTGVCQETFQNIPVETATQDPTPIAAILSVGTALIDPASPDKNKNRYKSLVITAMSLNGETPSLLFGPPLDPNQTHKSFYIDLKAVHANGYNRSFRVEIPLKVDFDTSTNLITDCRVAGNRSTQVLDPPTSIQIWTDSSSNPFPILPDDIMNFATLGGSNTVYKEVGIANSNPMSTLDIIGDLAITNSNSHGFPLEPYGSCHDGVLNSTNQRVGEIVNINDKLYLCQEFSATEAKWIPLATNKNDLDLGTYSFTGPPVSWLNPATMGAPVLTAETIIALQNQTTFITTTGGNKTYRAIHRGRVTCGIVSPGLPAVYATCPSAVGLIIPKTRSFTPFTFRMKRTVPY